MKLLFCMFFFFCVAFPVQSVPKTPKKQKSLPSISVGILQYPYKEGVRYDSNNIIWNTQETPPIEQMLNGINLVYATLFPDVTKLSKLGLKGDNLKKYETEVANQTQFFQRLYLFFKYAGVHYQSKAGMRGVWPFPLATVLTQGQRIFIELDGITPEEFLDFLTNGEMNLLDKRRYSSHGIVYNADKTNIIEKKIKTPLQKRSKTEALYGMNFSFGGVGNKLPDGNFVGPRGWEISSKGKVDKSKQTGHLHLVTRYFPKEKKTILLIGVEACAPETKNQFGCAHNVLSGLRNQTKNTSVSGGSKWAALAEEEAPTEYKGKYVWVGKGQFDDIKKKITQVLAGEDEMQLRKLFQEILAENGEKFASPRRKSV